MRVVLRSFVVSGCRSGCGWWLMADVSGCERLKIVVKTLGNFFVNKDSEDTFDK